MSFSLHPQLAADTAFVADLPHCRVLLMNNSRFPWLILVPRVSGLSELFDLSAADHDAVMREVRQVSLRFYGQSRADKMNVAALGNVVPQLHIHVIARYRGDDAWPSPVWGSQPTLPYDAQTLDERLSALRSMLQDML